MEETSARIREQLGELAAMGGNVRIGYPRWLALLLREGTLAITLGGRVYLAESAIKATAEQLEALLAHEIEHVRQFRRVGALRFVYCYVRDYLMNRRKGMSAFDAYMAIGFEVEARTAERSLPRSGERGGDGSVMRGETT